MLREIGRALDVIFFFDLDDETAKARRSAARTRKGVRTTRPRRSRAGSRSTTSRPSRWSSTTGRPASSSAARRQDRRGRVLGDRGRWLPWLRDDHPQVRPGDREDGRRRAGRRRDDRPRRRAARAGDHDRRARPDRRRAHPLARRRPDLAGLPRLPEGDLHLAERHGRARDPGRLRGRRRRPDHDRRRRHARRLHRRQRLHVPRRRRQRAGAAAARRRPTRSPPGSPRRAGQPVGDISAAVQQHVEGAGFSVVRSLVGHGVGRSYHEDPHIPNFGQPAAAALARG